MTETIAVRRLPPKTKTLLRVITAGLALLALFTAARMVLMLSKVRRGEVSAPAVPAKGAAKTALDSLGAIPFSAPPSSQKTEDQKAGETPPPPPLDTSGLDLKGVFVNMFDKRKSVAIVGAKGMRDLILKTGDSAKNGVALDEIFADHVVFRGVAGDRKSLALANFVKGAVILGEFEALTESLADSEDPMGQPVFDPTSPGPGMAGDVMGNGGIETGPVKYMPIPQMQTTQSGEFTTAAPMVTGSATAVAISEQMNAPGRTPAGGQQ